MLVQIKNKNVLVEIKNKNMLVEMDKSGVYIHLANLKVFPCWMGH